MPITDLREDVVAMDDEQKNTAASGFKAKSLLAQQDREPFPWKEWMSAWGYVALTRYPHPDTFSGAVAEFRVRSCHPGELGGGPAAASAKDQGQVFAAQMGTIPTFGDRIGDVVAAVKEWRGVPLSIEPRREYFDDAECFLMMELQCLVLTGDGGRVSDYLGREPAGARFPGFRSPSGKFLGQNALEFVTSGCGGYSAEYVNNIASGGISEILADASAQF